MCPAAAVCVSTLGVHRSREETGVVCFLDPVLTPLQAFVRLSFISTSWTSDWREYFTFAVYINNLYFHVSWTLICHLLISSCLWILPLLLSRKDTWVSLYCVMTSTNFLDSTVCWGQVGKHEDVTLEVHFMAVYKRHIVFPLPNRGLRFVLGSNYDRKKAFQQHLYKNTTSASLLMFVKTFPDLCFLDPEVNRGSVNDIIFGHAVLHGFSDRDRETKSHHTTSARVWRGQ